jgi:NTP pyrophosphatase (non-canonical NTP hydrolase)
MSEKMTSENYVANVLRTESPGNPETVARLIEPRTIRLIHAAMGLVSEAAELMDMLKKHIFYGKKLDLVNAVEEVGDGQWYAGLAIDVLETTFDEVLTKNIAKLRTRYPEKFTEDAAINRNLKLEREVLEK